MDYYPHYSQGLLSSKPTKVHASCCIVWKMKRRSSNEILKENIQKLLDYNGWSARQLATKAKIDGKTISKIFNKDSAPTSRTIDAIAGAFRLESWQLMIPGLDPNQVKGVRFRGVIDAYLNASENGQKLIEQQAEYIKANNHNPANGDKVNHSGRLAG